jgi:hypothetical protein
MGMVLARESICCLGEDVNCAVTVQVVGTAVIAKQLLHCQPVSTKQNALGQVRPECILVLEFTALVRNESTAKGSFYAAFLVARA